MLKDYEVKLLNEYEERRGFWIYSDFQHSLGAITPETTSYHDANSLIEKAIDEKKWHKVIRGYCVSLFHSQGDIGGLTSSFYQYLDEYNEEEKEGILVKFEKYEFELLDEYEANESSWSYSQFDSSLNALTQDGASHYDARDLIVRATLNGRWPKATLQYHVSSYELIGEDAGLVDSFHKILNRLSENDKINILQKIREK